ncbi:hypothetical protein [Turicibacter sanguinis]|uniref:hypothetical protein n=1 Tax=Turicibacter sanguinis TaxID=154288 RepID=UPI0018A0E9DE|nr:hypothetical protein [Turicibacter sanguinis]
MKIFDKAQWHIDGGENSSAVTNKFIAIFEFLNEEEFLSHDGLEILELGIDSSVSLNEKMVTEIGFEFLEKYYDEVINYGYDEIAYELRKRYCLFIESN